MLNLYVRFVYPKLHENSGFSALLLYAAYLLEESLPVYSILFNDRNFRIGFGTWLLVSVVITQGPLCAPVELTNRFWVIQSLNNRSQCLGYIGVLITFLSSPLPLTSISTFHQLSNLGCNYSPLNSSVPVENPCPRDVWYNATFYRNRGNRKFEVGKDFKIASFERNRKDVEDLILSMSEFAFNLERFATDRYKHANCTRNNDQACLELNHEEISNSPRQDEEDITVFGLLHPFRFFLPDVTGFENSTPINHVVERELIKCEKLVIVGDERFIENEFQHVSRKKFFIGKQPILITRFGLMVENQGFSSVSKIIASVYESGLYKLLENVQIGKSNLAHQLTRGGGWLKRPRFIHHFISGHSAKASDSK
ncbi:hypothetical protein Fcan01_26193 [Folsomia candida]|uniref:Uncharacterized protein n=1 Tax=Folsomia candida TaxID=158441 RepID=A0A226D1R5_FOLCA|nr:hypothetical protein Fcan01_26193 [Folsomia candida]